MVEYERVCAAETKSALHHRLRSIKMLKRYGIHVLYQPERYPLKNQIPAHVILDELHILINR